MRNLGDTELKRLHREWRRRTEDRLVILLDDVQTPYNVGSIVRTAAALRVEHLHVAGASAAPSHPRAHKTSLGTERYVEWTRHPNLADAIDEVKHAGLRLVGVELADGAVPLHEATLGGAVCLVFGHEDRGLSPPALAACDEVAFVPQLGKVGSLNVSQAAAMAMYEVRRRSWTG